MPPTRAVPDRQAALLLQASETRYRRLFETARDGILLLNADTAQIEDINPYLVEMLGYSHAEFLGKKLWEVGSFSDVPQSKEAFAELQKDGYVRYSDLPLRTKSGNRLDVDFVCNTYECDGVKVVQCNIRNITDRNADRAKLERQTALYTALSLCHEAIIHSRDEQDLFQRICRAAVQFGGVKMACVSIIDPVTLAMKPVASFADDPDYMQSVEVSADPDSPLSRGATGAAIRERRPAWRQDLANDSEWQPWRERGKRSGWAAAAALPLLRGPTVIGAFALYSGEKEAFDPALRQLLIGMVADIGFALENFEREAQKKRISENLEFRNALLQTQLETSLDAILVVGEKGEVVSYNQQFVKLWDISADLLLKGKDDLIVREIVGRVENKAEFLSGIERLYAHPLETSRDEIILMDGRIIDRYSAPATGADRRYYGRVWYFRDITERTTAERRFEGLLEAAPDAMVIVNAAAKMVLVNAQAVDMFGWSRQELIGKDVDILVPRRRRAEHPAKRSEYQRNPSVRTMNAGHDLLAERKDGTTFPVEISLSPLKVGGDDLVISAIRNVTERKAAEHTILRLNRVYAVLSGINTLIVRNTSRENLFREACRIAVEAGGFRMALIAMVDPIRGRIVPVASAGKDEQLKASIRSVLKSGGSQATMIGRSISERKVVVSNDSVNDPKVLFAKQYAQSGVGSMAILPLVIGDVALGAIALYATEAGFFHAGELTLLKELAGDIAFSIDHIGKQERLDYLAYYDVLTGLANRRLFVERVSQHLRTAVEAKHKLAVLVIDVERYRNFNDSLGRSAGDSLLRQVAEWLIANVSDANLLARLEADHFAVLLPMVKQDEDVARLIVQWLDSLAAHPFELNGAVYRVAAKIGAAEYPGDGKDVDALVKNAEVALKSAKAGGARYLFYSQEMNDSVGSRLALEAELRAALRNGEFVLYYQPKIDLASGNLTGTEALIRWNHPVSGMVLPASFIPILEETGLIHEVGRWALHTAIKDYLRWCDLGAMRLRVSVNVSALQLRSHGFIEEVRDAIAADPRAAKGLELEVTESLVMENVQNSTEILRSVRAMDVTVAIDDFGTGFSSLSYLSKLPVDTLKIDRSFVVEMTAGPQGLALVTTIINLAHSLGLKVVAEGVETEEQSHLLRLLRCDEVQGYLIGRPAPRDEFERKFIVTH